MRGFAFATSWPITAADGLVQFKNRARRNQIEKLAAAAVERVKLAQPVDAGVAVAVIGPPPADPT